MLTVAVGSAVGLGEGARVGNAVCDVGVGVGWGVGV